MQTDSVRKQGSMVYVWGVCLVAALGGLLFGYDTGVINGSIDFVVEKFEVTKPFLVGFTSSCALVGCIIGVAFAGVLSDLLGRKKVLILSAIAFLVSAVGTAIPNTLMQFIVFRIIGGLGVGAASMTSPVYIAEISPARIRGRMVSVNQFGIVTGILGVYFINYFIARYGVQHNEELWNLETGWRWMFGSESFPALLLLILVFFVPESPRWLTKRGKQEEALRILSRVDGSDYAQKEMQEIQQVLSEESVSLKHLFLPGMRIVLVIGVVLAVMQQTTGINVFLYFGSGIFKKLGGDAIDTALLQQIVVGSANMLFTIVAIWMVDKWGRKPLMLIGSAGMGLSLLAMSGAAYFQSTGIWLLFFIVSYIACFALSVGPVTWVILSEIFPTKIRGRAMSIATICLWAANTVVTQTFPMMSNNEYLVTTFHNAFPFWIYGFMCVILIFFLQGFVPETKGKSLEEIESLWLKK